MLNTLINKWQSFFPAVASPNSYVQWGKKREAPTFSNIPDCDRFKCPPTPWHWATRWVLERSILNGSEIICDLGAGNNPIALETYRKHPDQVYLIDIDLAFLPKQSEITQNIKCIQADISCLSLADETVDVVTSTSVLEHLPAEKRIKTLQEAARILKPGGRLVVSIGHFMNVSEEAKILMRELPYFTDRGCAAYLPISLPELIGTRSNLQLVTDYTDLYPGEPFYNETSLLQDKNLCLAAYKDYAELRSHPSLEPVVYCELGLVLFKPQGRN